MFLCCLVINMMTQVTSNSSTMMIFAALLCDMAENLGINPMYLIVPCAASVSMAFCLPVSTPPNAVVFEYGMSDSQTLTMFLTKFEDQRFEIYNKSRIILISSF